MGSVYGKMAAKLHRRGKMALPAGLRSPAPHCSGKVAIVGHTPQHEILDLGLFEMPRHPLLPRWLADGVGRGQRTGVAGERAG